VITCQQSLITYQQSVITYQQSIVKISVKLERCTVFKRSITNVDVESFLSEN